MWQYTQVGFEAETGTHATFTTLSTIEFFSFLPFFLFSFSLFVLFYFLRLRIFFFVLLCPCRSYLCLVNTYGFHVVTLVMLLRHFYCFNCVFLLGSLSDFYCFVFLITGTLMFY